MTQTEGSVTLPEGTPLTLNCTYQSSYSVVAFWYVQYQNKEPKLLLKSSSENRRVENHGFQASLKSDKSFHLEKRSVQMSDSAVYYCAVGGWQLTFGSGTQLTVVPDITDPDPAVYQLRSPKSSNISVCLFTDFDSETNEEQAPESTMIKLKSTVLDMWSMNSKSNGALAWSTSTDFKCNETFHKDFYSSSDFSCNATLIEKNFETDMNLNFHNLFMIGLRVILLKVAGFNLFMTLQLWSR